MSLLTKHPVCKSLSHMSLLTKLPICNALSYMSLLTKHPICKSLSHMSLLSKLPVCNVLSCMSLLTKLPVCYVFILMFLLPVIECKTKWSLCELKRHKGSEVMTPFILIFGTTWAVRLFRSSVSLSCRKDGPTPFVEEVSGPQTKEQRYSFSWSRIETKTFGRPSPILVTTPTELTLLIS